MMDIVQDAPQTAILAEDECWMYLQATTMHAWSGCGQTPLVRVDPGRTKMGFYGTLDLRTGREIVTRSPIFNSDVSAQHLQTILETFPDQPIFLLLDRAPWHRGAALRQLCETNPRLEIMFFPVGSPDLNPQEHVWKQTRRAVSHNHLVPKLPTLVDQFATYLHTHIFRTSFLDRYAFHDLYPMFI